MSNFEVLVTKVDAVEKHPDADTLHIYKIGGYVTISKQNDDGTPRYKVDELVVYIPEGSLLPDWLLKHLDLWDENKNQGALSSPNGRRLKPKKLRGVFSEGMLYPIRNDMGYDNGHYLSKDNDFCWVNEGDNVAEFLGITKYEPTVPVSMRGALADGYSWAGKKGGAFIEFAKVFDTDSIKKHWNMFEEGEEVVVTEKIHGTQIIIAYVPELNDPMLFGTKGNIFVTSKGVGAQGFVYKNLEQNDSNIYCTTLKTLLNANLEALLEEYLQKMNVYRTPEENEIKTIHLFGEVFGAGVQDLHYGQRTPTVRFFDIALNKKFINPVTFHIIESNVLGLQTVPVLYSGPFNREHIKTLVSGKDFSGSHIREGIVIKGMNDHPKYGRKVAKWVSPEYLLRKGNTTEYT